MKKTAALIISSMLVLSSLFVMLDMTAEGKDIAPIPLFSGAGSGTVADPYQITDVDELQEMNLDLNAHYILMNDIDASLTSGWNSDKGFEPIANLTGYFNGTLDGMDFIIHDLTVNRSSQDYAGLFGYLNQSAVISNLGLENVNITGAGFVGGLAGWSDGTIMDSHSAGNVTGGVDSGGFTGASTGPITNCYSTGTLTGTGDSVGGFVGYNAAPITNTYSTVNVTTIGITAGGFAGSNSHTATNCYSTGNVIGTSEVGGFAGLINGGTTINCYSTGNVDGTVKAGGFAGWINAGTAKSSYSTGTVAGIIYVGGFNGITDAGGTITNCYSTGNVIGTSDYIGGFIGNNWQGTISNCHSTGSATTPWHALGGFTGGNEAPSIITDSYATGNAIITGAGWEVGGFSGQNHGSIERCYSLGDATTAGGGIAGGFVGNNYNIITDCFALGNADASSDRVGGFAGYNSDGDTITSCYSIGTASGGIPGGFVGENGVGSTISISHWDITTSGTGSGVNINSGVADVTGHTTIAMKQIATYPGWDFATVWGIVEDNTYAFLTTIDPIVINEQITQIGMATEDIGYSTDFNSTAQPIPFYNKLESWAMNTDADWLSISPLSGVVSGTPVNAEVGTFWVNVTATDNLGSEGHFNYTLVVENTDLTITTTDVLTTNIEALYEVDYSSTDDPSTSWSIITDAPFLGIDLTTGILSGTPSNAQAGTYNVEVTVDDGNGGTDTQAFTLTVDLISDHDGDGIDDSIDDDDDWDGWDDAIEIAGGFDPLDNNSVPTDEDSDGIADFMDPDFLTVTEYNNQTIWVNVPEYHNSTIWINNTVPEFHNSTVWNNETIPEYYNSTIWQNQTVPEYHNSTIWNNSTADSETVSETPAWAWGAVIAAVVMGVLAIIGFTRGGSGGKPEVAEESKEPGEPKLES